MNYILYTRTSTKTQTLGLEAQRQTANNFISSTDTIVREYTEQESGTTANRPQLIKAIAETQATGSTLLIANLSRLSRNAKFTFGLMDAGVNFKCCDMPNANTLTIGLMAVIAQDFATTLSTNTKKGIAVSQANGVKWGTNNLTIEGGLKGANTMKQRAERLHFETSNTIINLRNGGLTFLQIANKLNENGKTTTRGNQYLEQTVSRLFKRATATAPTS